MLEFEKGSSKSTSVDDTSHTFTSSPNVRNGFRRKKGDSPFSYNLNLKVKKEKKQPNCTNPDPWARIVGSRNTAAIYMNGVATTALFDTGAEIQLVSKQVCEDNEWEIQPIEKLTECSTMNGEIFGYEGFVEVNVQIPGRDFSEDHLFLVTSEISHQKEIPVVLGTYFIDSLSKYLHGIDKEEFDSLDYTVKQAYLSWVEATRIREKYGCEPPLGFVKTTKPVLIQANLIDLSGLDDWPEHLQSEAKEMLKRNARVFSKTDLDMDRTNLVKHHIKLTDPVPFKEAYRRIPPQMYDEVKAHIQEMLDLGAIRPSNSPWASAIVLVRKMDGRLRFCIDLRRLNNRTVKDA